MSCLFDGRTRSQVQPFHVFDFSYSPSYRASHARVVLAVEISNGILSIVSYVLSCGVTYNLQSPMALSRQCPQHMDETTNWSLTGEAKGHVMIIQILKAMVLSTRK